MRFRHPAVAAVAVLLCASLAVAVGEAHARGQLQTRQTGIDLPSGTRAGRLVLANTGDEPVAAQIRVYAWTQPDGEDRLEPSDRIAASPPIVEIAPGTEQLIRLVRPGDAPLAEEHAYRVVVDELPGSGDEDAGSAINMRMRYLLPMFVRAADAAPVALQCHVAGSELVCHNSGGRAAQLGATRLVSSDGREVEITPGLLGYVLAGSTRRFPLDTATLAALGSPAKLQVRLNGQPATVDLTTR